MRAFFLAFFASFPLHCAAASDTFSDMVGTNRVLAAPFYSRGEFAGCGMQFAAIVRDTTYERGEFVAVRGSLVLNLVGSGKNMSIGPALRLGVFRLAADGSMVPATPDYVYAEGSEGSIARTIIDSAASDEPGYRLAVVRLDTPIFGLIADASRARTVVVGYSRGPRGMDQRVPIDFSVVDTNIVDGKVVRTRSQTQAKEFEKCFTRLVMAVPSAK